MKNLKFISALVVIIALASCSSCSSDDNKDGEKPTLNIVAPANGKVVHPGDDIHVEVDFYDNEELASWKIDIHWAGDGHDHQHKSANVSDDDHVKWSYEKTGTLSGKTDHIHVHTDKVPANVEEGEYHFGVYVIDKAGNQSVQWVDIDIHNHGDGGHDHDDDDHDQTTTMTTTTTTTTTTIID